MTMFWIFIVVGVALVIGASVLVGKMVSGGRNRGGPVSRQDEMTALKASGALRHRKSNRE